MSRFLHTVKRTVFLLLRGFLLVLLVVIPLPIGELFHRQLERRRRAVAEQQHELPPP